jgi:hypothetical protein
LREHQLKLEPLQSGRQAFAVWGQRFCTVVKHQHEHIHIIVVGRLLVVWQRIQAQIEAAAAQSSEPYGTKHQRSTKSPKWGKNDHFPIVQVTCTKVERQPNG